MNIQQLKKNPKEALEDYINCLHNDYYLWYERATHKNKKFWGFGQWLIILSGIVTTVLAAIQTSDFEVVKNHIYVIRGLLIFVPIVGTVATSFLLKSKVFELYSLRERGRERIQYLIDEGKRLYAVSNTDEEYSKNHNWLIEEVSKVEKDQASDFFTTAPN